MVKNNRQSGRRGARRDPVPARQSESNQPWRLPGGSPANPARPNRPLLAVSVVLFGVWFVFLVRVALFG